MQKKYFYSIVFVCIVAITVSLWYGILFYKKTAPYQPTDIQTQLHIPELIDSKEMTDEPIKINIQNGEKQFYPGIKSNTKGFNGDYLGPTIKLYKGHNTRIQFINQLDEVTTIHGHGLHVPGEVDGGPQQKIRAGSTWDVTLPIRQQAGTSWYHPHIMMKTASQVHAGLAGLYIIEDEKSLKLSLPRNYGVDDIPLVIQDREFIDGKMQDYVTGQNKSYEPTIIVNGDINPVTEVPQGFVRLRLLNGANTRSLTFSFSDNRTFYKIASEGGYLESPVEMKSLRMAPGERNEIIVNLSDGGPVDLMGAFAFVTENFITKLIYPRNTIMSFKTNSKLEAVTEISNSLNTIDFYSEADVKKTRYFELDDMKINNKKMDHTRIDEYVTKGELEKWVLEGEGHPFHMHGTSFQIISNNGETVADEDKEWKDTIYLNGKHEILVRFDYEATEKFPYMYHCHILEHEDMGMMGQFTVK